MPNVRENRIKTLNHYNKTSSSTGLKTYKKKLYETRKPIRIDRHIRKLTEEFENEDSYEEGQKDLTIIQANYIKCPECNDLIDVRPNLEDTKSTKVKCKTCGTYDIDLLRELKAANKLNLAKSAGIPTGKLLVDSDNYDVRNMIVRPTQLKRDRQIDQESGLRIRKIKDTTVANQNRQQHIDKDFMTKYDLMSDQEKVMYDPVKSLIDKGLQIKRVIDLSK